VIRHLLLPESQASGNFDWHTFFQTVFNIDCNPQSSESEE
jgi:hypothetical protein